MNCILRISNYKVEAIPGGRACRGQWRRGEEALSGSAGR